MTWLDYRHIKASVPIEKVIAHYNIRLKKTSNHHFAGSYPIPSHSGDRSNKNAFHVDTQAEIEDRTKTPSFVPVYSRFLEVRFLIHPILSALHPAFSPIYMVSLRMILPPFPKGF